MQLPALKTKYIGLLADRLGLLPACESTLTSHDILHVFDVISEGDDEDDNDMADDVLTDLLHIDFVAFLKS